VNVGVVAMILIAKDGDSSHVIPGGGHLEQFCIRMIDLIDKIFSQSYFNTTKLIEIATLTSLL